MKLAPMRFNTMYHNVLAQTSQTNFHQQQPQSTNNGPQSTQWQQYCRYPPYDQRVTGPPLQHHTMEYGCPPHQDWYAPPQPLIPRGGGVGVGGGGGGGGGRGTHANEEHQLSYVPMMYTASSANARPLVMGAPNCSAPIFILPSNNCPNPSQLAGGFLLPNNVSPNLVGSFDRNIDERHHYHHHHHHQPMLHGVERCSNYSTHHDRSSIGETQSGRCVCCSRSSRKFGFERTDEDEPFPGTGLMAEHQCPSSDERICTSINSPSSINLQALASQLLGVAGIISCAATRLVLRKVPGSNITTSVEETIERAKRALQSTLTKDQLLAETRAAQQVNALINLHMTANPPRNVIPILTTIQLKVNVLKSIAESSLNRRLSDNQGYARARYTGSEGPEGGELALLDSYALGTKSQEELRLLLNTLRQRESDERINLNFALYKSQRAIARSRLENLRKKIMEVEEEIDRRVCTSERIEPDVPSSSLRYGYAPTTTTTTRDLQKNGPCTSSLKNQNYYESPDPFRPVNTHRSPRRLNIKGHPHFGTPESTCRNDYSSGKLNKKWLTSSRRNVGSDEDESTEEILDKSSSPGEGCCDCENSGSEEQASDSGEEAKKKLAGKKEASAQENGSKEIVLHPTSNEGNELMIAIPPNHEIIIRIVEENNIKERIISGTRGGFDTEGSRGKRGKRASNENMGLPHATRQIVPQYSEISRDEDAMNYDYENASTIIVSDSPTPEKENYSPPSPHQPHYQINKSNNTISIDKNLNNEPINLDKCYCIRDSSKKSSKSDVTECEGTPWTDSDKFIPGGREETIRMLTKVKYDEPSVFLSNFLEERADTPSERVSDSDNGDGEHDAIMNMSPLNGPTDRTNEPVPPDGPDNCDKSLVRSNDFKSSPTTSKRKEEEVEQNVSEKVEKREAIAKSRFIRFFDEVHDGSTRCTLYNEESEQHGVTPRSNIEQSIVKKMMQKVLDKKYEPIEAKGSLMKNESNILTKNARKAVKNRKEDSRGVIKKSGPFLVAPASKQENKNSISPLRKPNDGLHNTIVKIRSSRKFWIEPSKPKPHSKVRISYDNDQYSAPTINRLDKSPCFNSPVTLASEEYVLNIYHYSDIISRLIHL